LKGWTTGFNDGAAIGSDWGGVPIGKLISVMERGVYVGQITPQARSPLFLALLIYTPLFLALLIYRRNFTRPSDHFFLKKNAPIKYEARRNIRPKVPNA
jgi:hypothetical protein